MNFASLIFEPMSNLIKPLTVYFGLVIVLDYIRTMLFPRGG